MARVLLLASFVAPHAFGQEARYELQIESQPISSALSALAAQTGLQVLVFSQDAAEKQSNGVRGYLTDDEALVEILDDSGLTYQKIDDHTIVIRQSSPQAIVRPISYAIDGPQGDAPGNAASNASTNIPQSGSGEGALQEIVVTAQRREESINKVPISISAMSQATIDSLGIKDFSDMAKYTPGVTIDSDRTNEISIRGIASTGGADTTGRSPVRRTSAMWA